MWWYIVQGIGYGFAAAVQPGPLQTYLISQALMKGWRKSLPSAFAPLLSDGPIVALCLLVLSHVPAWRQRFLYIAGGLFVLYLAYSTYRSWMSFDPHLPIPETKPGQSLLNAALSGSLNSVEYQKDPVFGFDVPTSCEGVPSHILDPANTWPSREEYFKKYDGLAARFIENFKLFADGCSQEVIDAGPKRMK